jgi:hypothetical protein
VYRNLYLRMSSIGVDPGDRIIELKFSQKSFVMVFVLSLLCVESKGEQIFIEELRSLVSQLIRGLAASE